MLRNPALKGRAKFITTLRVALLSDCYQRFCSKAMLHHKNIDNANSLARRRLLTTLLKNIRIVLVNLVGLRGDIFGFLVELIALRVV